MRIHIQWTVYQCFAKHRQLRQTRQAMRARASCLPTQLVIGLQAVLNSAVDATRLNCNLRYSNHIADMPFTLHWLHIPVSVCSGAVLWTHRSCCYLWSRQSVHSAGTNCLVISCQLSAVEPTQWPDLSLLMSARRHYRHIITVYLPS